MNIEEEIKIVPMIGNIKIKDEGIIEEAELEFAPGLNIIVGSNASGKTTVLNSIEKQSDHIWSLEQLKASSAASEKIMLSLIGITQTPIHKCFLIDNLIERLSRDKVKILLQELERTKNQIIITASNYVEISKIKANIIDTKDFKLKRIGKK
ncbi:MAG: AAA family ATPase [Nanoarchaeota archaeon]|nr:AAA family ATPase [Nanoarchaeota archaeon]MBU1030249.1 AAA family ATPase [Nanoarchaeota archaeon]